MSSTDRPNTAQDAVRTLNRSREAFAAYDAYQHRLDDMLDRALGASVPRPTPNPLIPIVFADGYTNGQTALAQQVHDMLGAAMLRTTRDGDYVLSRGGVKALLDLVRALEAQIRPAGEAAV